jgi:hypothetical protein
VRADIGVPGRQALYRVAGICAIALGLSYLAITALYIAVGGAAPSGGGEIWFDYLAGQSATWWGIVGLSALTDVLFLPLAAALYSALATVNRTAMLIGAGLLLLFAVLDLAVTQLNFGVLITLSDAYAATSDETERTALVAAANYPAAVLDSALWAVYVLLVPGLGILAISLVMLRGGDFGRIAAYVGVLTGIGGIVSVSGALFWQPLAFVAIPTSVLTTIWVFLVGYRLLRMGLNPGAS